ncbi:MAG: chromosome segregation protein SMC [Alphaproteobacteria bacterium]
MQVERLRLAGFKSFVEPTELVIAPGLTGIVGPNGCGKSNLVEALRWVMGEASARRLRGGEMDDVIFGGSERRPARNLADVSLTVNNSARDAPLAFNDSAIIEVARRIVRGGGSTYRINGREVRARDVHLLFADAASGPHSGALVGQGRIGALIAATPRERRALLDQAAGTAGLYARRHEAELKLRAAEENLARLGDVTATLAAQIETLKKQARQAMRYRRLGEQIRETEARLLHVRWRQAAAEAEHLAAALRDAERDLAAAGDDALGREQARAQAELALPPLRQRQSSAAAELQLLGHASEALDQELARVTAARADSERRLAQIAGDRDRETERHTDAEAALTRLAKERSALESAGAGADDEHRVAAACAESAAGNLAAAETRLQQAIEAAAAAEARRTSLERRRRELVERRDRLVSRLADSEKQRRLLLAASVSPEAAEAASMAVTQAAADAVSARAAAMETAERLAAAQRCEAAAFERSRDADRVLAPLEAEAKALSRILAPGDRSRAEGPMLLSQLRVSAGFEAAVAALFDGELTAPLVPEPGIAPSAITGAGWVALAAFDPAPLPDGARPLGEAVAAPAALARCLAHAGWVETAAEGWRLQARLSPGQSLVDRDGRLWRWDGFVRIGAAASAAAEQLRQRNRLEQLQSEIAEARTQAQQAGERAAHCRAQRETAAAAERAAAVRLRPAEELLARARHAETELSRRGLAAEAKLTAIVEAIDRITTDLTESATQIAEADGALALLPDPAASRAALDKARSGASAARRRDAEARAALDRVVRTAEGRRRRLMAIAGEAESWRKRREDAAAQQAVLAERHVAAAAEIEALTARPPAIAAEREALAGKSAAAAAERRAAEAALTAAETMLHQTIEAARRAEATIAAMRECRAGLQAHGEAAADTLRRLRAEIGERLGIGPDELDTLAGSSGGAGDGEGIATDLAARLDRLVRERNGMGAVNLLAATQAAEIETRLDGLERERADLIAAIARLRRGIATLDHEGRKRLTAAFDALNEHFGNLFARLFGGGRAELAWAGSEDPLEAGLDILASPPGKRLASLSLLSGGEQALTAIALIFAMFLTHPAPICVLDEVDAPLDDVNVDGFCRLVSDIAGATGTRFLVITHHRVTMAHMDRLFGVTMAERGVSQLVSVDLARAAVLRQTA